ncbi:MAG: tyrosyl-tRNA synthetase [Candidatus Woesearchaeota archaeon]|nr:tyrosyl-tRNA synthetase [Candidatus Woesearchaeota archaeon]
MDIQEKYNLITRNLQEIITKDELGELLKTKKEISVYWGTMPTGSISIAYFFPMMKIADFLKAGLKVKILIADLHAALDGVPWDLLDKRTEYYKRAIILILETIGVDIEKLEFIRGRDFQLNGKYFEDVLKLAMVSNVKNCKKAASEVVKMAENPFLGNLIYPLMQALDEEYLKVDIQYGGLDQRKVMVYARENLPKIGYKPRVELITPMIRGLVGEKMSSSIEATKIDLLDDEDTVERKIKKAECIEGNPDNGIMSLLKYLIMILKEDAKESFIVERPEKFGGNVEYNSYEEIEKDFVSKKLHPLDLKNAVSKELNLLLKNFRNDKELLDIHKKAYE